MHCQFYKNSHGVGFKKHVHGQSEKSIIRHGGDGAPGVCMGTPDAHMGTRDVFTDKSSTKLSGPRKEEYSTVYNGNL